VNPQALKLKIDNTEEELRTNKIPKEQQADAIVGLAANYAELRQHEKAIEYLGRVLRTMQKPDSIILNRMGLYRGELGDETRQVTVYNEAAKNDPSWNTPWFNLAYVQLANKQYVEAMDSINRAISKGKEAHHFVIKARIAAGQGDDKGKAAALKEAMELFGPIEKQRDFELGWFIGAAQMLDDEKKVEAAEQEQKKRLLGAKPVADNSALPILEQQKGNI